MPVYEFTCEVCGALRRAWRKEGCPPRFCGRACKTVGLRGQPRRVARYVISPVMHAQIREVYQQMTGNGEVEELAAKLGLPRWKVTRYAISQGWIPRGSREPEWTGPELHILEASAHCHPEVIQRHLKKAGFSRCASGIVQKRKRLHLPKNLGGQSVTQLAGCFGVDQKVVQSWVFKGFLKAEKRGTHRQPQQGGDIYFIRDLWVRQFILEYPELVDLRKVDKFWFIDIVAGRADGIPTWGPAVHQESCGRKGEWEVGSY